MAVNFRGVAASFRTLGVASSPQNLFAIENQAASGLFIALRELRVYKDMTALQSAIGPITRVSVPTGTRAGGTPATKTKHSDVGGTNASSASAVFVGAASADGTASAITGLTAGTTLWQTQTPKALSLAGVMLNASPDVIPETCRDIPWIVYPSTSLLLQLVNAGLTTDHYYVDCLWEEWTTATG